MIEQDDLKIELVGEDSVAVETKCEPRSPTMAEDVIGTPSSPKVLIKKYGSVCSEDHEGVCSRVASARSSGSSSAYYSSTSSCLFDYASSTPVPSINLGSVSKRRTRLCCEQDISSIFSSDREEKEEEEEEIGQLVGQPSLKMIRKLKRMSDAWSRVSRSSDNDSEIIDRLKKGREEAKRRQTYIEDLLKDANCQYQIQRKAKSVMKVCPDDGGMDDVEAERIILLAGERYKAYHEEAERIVTELGASVWDLPSGCLDNEQMSGSPATLYISDIKLKLSDEFSASLEASPKSHAHHFLCLLREKMTKGIIATQILSLEGESCANSLHYSNLLTLPEIPPNFVLVIEIYHMSNSSKQKKKKVFSKVMRSVKRVPTLSKSTRYLSCTRPATEDGDDEEEEEEKPIVTISKENLVQSEFVHVGEVTITRETLMHRDPYETTDQEIVSSLELTVSADPLYEGRLISGPVEGFLDCYHLSSWNRSWFVLKDSSLVCWPSQEHNDCAGPTHEWDISECYKTVVTASPVDCGRKNAFVLPLSSHGEDRELLLAADNPEELEEWLTALNSFIIGTSEWHTESTA